MVDRKYNDAFAWFLNGQNIAIIPGTNEMVSIDTINIDAHSDLFINNDPNTLGTGPNDIPFPKFEADGFTKSLKAEGVTNGGTNHMKLVIADRADNGFNSWALLKANSFRPVVDREIERATGGGDPHFSRWGHSERDSFQGECDLVLMKSENFHEHGLDFHIRTTLRSDVYSYIESAALRIGDYTVEIHNGHVLLDGFEYKEEELPIEFGEEKSYKLSLDNIQRRRDGSVARRKYRLSLDDTEIVFKYYKHIMTFTINGHNDFADAAGMLGAYPHGAMISRHGKIMDNFEEFGFEWQVNLEDPVLFSDVRSPQLPYERCRMPSGDARTSRRRLRGGDDNTQLRMDAEKACAHVTGSNFDLCVSDVVTTEDLELANEW